tara:strand:- start:1183 stop:2493 length:1311 start_codon:yes stop_codon:yes gene_type:complete
MAIYIQSSKSAGVYFHDFFDIDDPLSFKFQNTTLAIRLTELLTEYYKPTSQSPSDLYFSSRFFPKDLDLLDHYFTLATSSSLVLLHPDGEPALAITTSGTDELEVHYIEKDSFFDFTDASSFFQFLVKSSTPRSFNRIELNCQTLLKRSSRTSDLSKEFKFLNSLPRELSKYYVKASSFTQKSQSASYVMPIVSSPSMAHLCANGYFSTKARAHSFFTCLKNYHSKTVVKNASPSFDSFSSFLICKNIDRFNLLKTSPHHSYIEATFSEFTNTTLDFLLEDLNAIIQQNSKYLNCLQTGFQHGDLCFSNILYNANDSTLKLIDPSGERTPFIYDLAKLSQSIFSNYDLLACNRFQLSRLDSLSDFEKVFDSLDNMSALRTTFLNFLQEYHFNLPLIRIIEASLFFSMMPLHLDNPDRVVLQGLTSFNILRSLKEQT